MYCYLRFKVPRDLFAYRGLSYAILRELANEFRKLAGLAVHSHRGTRVSGAGTECSHSKPPGSGRRGKRALSSRFSFKFWFVKRRIPMKISKWHLFATGLILVSLSSHAWAGSPNLPFGQTTTGTIGSVAQTNSYTFSANASDVVILTMVATSGTLSPKIQLYNSVGILISTAYNNNGSGGCGGGSTIEMNTVVLTTTGTYTVDVSDCAATNTGGYLIYIQRTNNPSGAENLPFSQVQTGTIGSAAQSNTYTFNANLNDEVDFTLYTTSGNLSPKIRLYNGSNGTLISTAYNNNGSGGCGGGSTLEMNTIQIPATGSYTVLVGDCGDTNTGDYEIYAQLTDNPSGAPNLPFGQIQTGSISSATQSNAYTFSANANDVVDLTMLTTSGSLSPKIRLYNPSGTLVSTAYNNNGSGGCAGGSTLEMNSVTLKQAGIFTVLVGDCGDTNTGDYLIYMQRTNNPSGATFLLFGPVQTGMIGSAAQSNTYTFSASAGDEVDFTMVATSGNLSPRIRLYSPAGALLSTAYNNNGSGGCAGGSTLEMNTVKLPLAGAYTVLFADCGDTNTGNYLIYTQRTNNPFGPAPVVWGQVQTDTIGSAAQSNTYTFAGSTNDSVDFTLVATSGTLSPKIRLYNPDGTLLSQAFSNNGSGGCGGGTTVEMSSVTLAQNGDYTVLVGDCADTNSGNYNLSSQCFGTCPTMPAITWATPAAITYGTPLSATQLDASASVGGTYVYSPVSGTVLTVGLQTLMVTFTPTDTTDYSTAKDFVQLTVNKATPAITWATPAPIFLGTPLSATQLDATSPVAGTFVYNPPAGTVLAIGTQTLSVTFTPTDTTDYTTNTATVQLSVINPGASLSPTSVAFGNKEINIASVVKNVFLTSSGTTNLSKPSITITGTNAPDFSPTNTCTAASYAPGAKCTISVKFTPSMLAAESASLMVTDNASNSPQTVPLTGTGVPPVVLSPTSLSFGNLAEGDSSLSKIITLTNYLQVPLSDISVSTGSTGYPQTNTCGTSVAAGKKCTITVTFKPSIVGTDDATLSISDSASNSPQTAALTGKGEIPVTLSLATLAIGDVDEGVTSASKTVTVTNNQNVTLTGISVSTTSADYKQTNTCGTSIAAGKKCTITVTFKPSIIGTDDATLSITDSAVNSPQTAALTGTGTTPAGLSPASTIYASRTVGTTSLAKVFTLTSYLETTLTGIVISTTGDFAVSSTTCTTTLAAKGKCTIDVTFKPTATGARTGTLSVSDSAANSPQTSTLTGTGK